MTAGEAIKILNDGPMEAFLKFGMPNEFVMNAQGFEALIVLLSWANVHYRPPDGITVDYSGTA